MRSQRKSFHARASQTPLRVCHLHQLSDIQRTEERHLGILIGQQGLSQTFNNSTNQCVIMLSGLKRAASVVSSVTTVRRATGVSVSLQNNNSRKLHKQVLGAIPERRFNKLSLTLNSELTYPVK
ncbi:hypothetical protein J4Q44_G00132930 [Coregonus suidteri]|uniref:Uncharacterized protein n=1 Tax=Coregonus suidteri TaxID=861788 RepID=A0AAN8QTY9_9TELE